MDNKITEKFIHNYAEFMTDNMDLDSLVQYFYECQIDRLEQLSESEILEELTFYDLNFEDFE